MDPRGLDQVARILQLSITPVALISGVGLLLLSMTNRLGRIVDRSRVLGREAKQPMDDAARRALSAELRILFQRARLMQLAIASIATCIFLAALMVASLFAMNLLHDDLGPLVLGLFALNLLFLVASIVCFLGDIFLSIRWLHASHEDDAKT